MSSLYVRVVTNAATRKLGKACSQEHNECSIRSMMTAVRACLCSFLGHCAHKKRQCLVRLAHNETSDPNDKKVSEPTNSRFCTRVGTVCAEGARVTENLSELTRFCGLGVIILALYLATAKDEEVTGTIKDMSAILWFTHVVFFLLQSLRSRWQRLRGLASEWRRHMLGLRADRRGFLFLDNLSPLARLSPLGGSVRLSWAWWLDHTTLLEVRSSDPWPGHITFLDGNLNLRCFTGQEKSNGVRASLYEVKFRVVRRAKLFYFR